MEQISIQNDQMTNSSWHRTWMSIAYIIASRSHDPTLKVGAVLVPADNTGILALGYNGNYAGGPNERASMTPGESYFIHAEMNCLIKAPFHYPQSKIMYVTHFPCLMCCKSIINAKISQIYYSETYRDRSGESILGEAGIQITQVSVK